MVDTIRVNTELLERCAGNLKTTALGFDDAASMLAGLNTGAEWWTKMGRFASIKLQDEGTSMPQADAGEMVRALIAAMRRYNSRLTSLGERTADAAEMFEELENYLRSKAINQDGGKAGTLSRVEDASSNGSLDERSPAKTREEYYKRCAERRSKAIDDEVARLYDKFKSGIKIGDDKSTEAYYNSFFNRVYLNWKEDAVNERGECYTYFHEVGHMVDDYTSWRGDSSSSKEFSRKLSSDFENYVSKVMRDYSCNRKEAYEIISDWLLEDPDKKNGLSDLCGGLTGNECMGRWAHEDDYWKGKKENGIPDKVNNEAFAHFFEASMTTDSTKVDYIKEIFPNAYKEFKKIVRENI